MSLLTICQNVANDIGINEPSKIVGSNDKTAKRLLALLYKVGDEIREKAIWPQLEKSATITLADGEESYSLPADFDYNIYNTYWDQTNQWSIIGPYTAQEWREYKEGVVTSSNRKRFRISGITDKQFFVADTPGAGDAGNTFIFEYQSKNWFRPKTWTATTVFAANSYCFYNGNIYKTTIGGTTGSTPPTHTTGDVNDGGVTWTYYSDAYSTFTADTDESIFEETLVELGLAYRYLRSRRLPYQDYQLEFNNRLKVRSGAMRGRILTNGGGSGYGHLLDYNNIPENGYGS